MLLVAFWTAVRLCDETTGALRGMPWGVGFISVLLAFAALLYGLMELADRCGTLLRAAMRAAEIDVTFAFCERP